MSKPRFLPFRPRLLELFGSGGPQVSLPAEIVSGVTVGLIAIPLALALGIASVPVGVETPLPAPAPGIFTAIIAGFIISALGGSRVQIGGPTAAFIPIIILIISRHGYSGSIVAMVLLFSRWVSHVPMATMSAALIVVAFRMRDRGSHVIFSGIHQQPLQMLCKADFIDVLKRENLCATFDDALSRAKMLLEEKHPY